MTPEPETTLTMPVVPDEDTETLQAVTEPAPDPEPEAIATVTFAQWHHYPIGDALMQEMHGYDILPCGRCKTAFKDFPSDSLDRSRILDYLVTLAAGAGWQADADYVWCCPACVAELNQPAAEWDDGHIEAMRQHQRILSEHDSKARATMTAGGRYSWDYETWCGTWRPRSERCAPEPAAEQRAAA